MDAKQVIKALTDSDWSHSSIGNKAIIQAAIELLGARRGTDEQIEFERKLTCEAINGAIAFGYQNTNPPPSDDHWLAPFWKIGRKQAELEAAALHSDAAQAPVDANVRNALVSLECTAQWLENGSDAKAAAVEIRGVMNMLHATPVAPGAAAQGKVVRFDAVELILRDVCETEPADPDLNDTVCIDISDLKAIVERHIDRSAPSTGDLGAES